MTEYLATPPRTYSPAALVAVPRGADMRRKDSVLPWASLASIQLNPACEESSSHSAGVRR